MAKNIAHVLINITGLGLALAVCIVAFLNYQFDKDFDSFHENSERIFRIEHTQLIEGNPKYFATTPAQLGPALVDDIKGVESMVRFTKDLMGTLVSAGENENFTHLYYTDPGIFDLFTFPLIAGNKEAFHDNNSVFITERLALALFGDQDPVGKIVSIRDSPYTVGGILKNHPLNSSFQFEAIAPIHALFKDNSIQELSWGNIYGMASTFILVEDQKQIEAIEKSLQLYVPHMNEVNAHQVDQLYLAPFGDMAHRGRSILEHPFQPSLHPAAVLPPLLAAACILLLACFNFANTSIAIASRRLKEIGIRRVLGSNKRQLIQQFMGENMLLILFALLFALFITKFLVPAYSNMWDFMALSFSLSKNIKLWVFIIVILIATAIISGSYPAIYVSSFNPVKILQDKLKLRGNNIFSKAILTLQFSISALALFTAVTFIQNADYLDKFDIGYDGVYIFQVHGEDRDLELLKNSIQSYPHIERISESILGPFFNSRSIKYNELELETKMHFLDMESFSTLGFRLFEGRSFEPETQKTDELSSILVNKKFVEELGISEPVGKMVLMNDTLALTIIGVIENLLDEGAWTTKISPVFYRLADETCKAKALNIRIIPENRDRVIQYLKDEWDRLVPDRPFMGMKGDVFIEASEYVNNKVISIAIFLVLIAILLSAAGLYSQVSLRMVHRTKEIGIRTIFGATFPGLIKILNYEFLVILGPGVLLGLIAGYYSNIALMDSIWAYFNHPSALSFIIPVLLILVVSTLIVSGKVQQTASRNPVHALRYE